MLTLKFVFCFIVAEMNQTLQSKAINGKKFFVGDIRKGNIISSVWTTKLIIISKNFIGV